MADTEKKSIKKWAIIGTVTVVILWGANFLLLVFSDKERGVFGDMFGAVNALFSGLAFAGIIITILMQRHELELQRKELTATRKVFDKQSKIMTNQQNDNTFFNLLQNHRQLVSSFTKEEYKYDSKLFESDNYWKSYNPVQSGHELLQQIADCFITYLTEYSTSYRDKLITNLHFNQYPDYEYLINSEPATITMTKELLHIFKFIELKFQVNEEKTFYIETLMRSLTKQETFIFETIYSLFPNHREGIEFRTTYLDSHPFIDFRTCHLPIFEIRYKYDPFNSDKFIITLQHYSYLKNAEFVIYERLQKDNITIADRIPISGLELSHATPGNISILACLSASKFNKWDFQHSKYLENKKFAVHIQLEEQDQLFSIIFEIHYDLSDRVFYPGKPIKELTNIKLQELNKDTAKNLKSLLTYTNEKN